MVARKIQNSTAAAVEFGILNFGIIRIMVAKAARAKTNPFTCKITDPPEKNTFLIKNLSNLGSGLIAFRQKIRCLLKTGPERPGETKIHVQN